MSKIKKLQMAITLFEQIDYLSNIDMIGILYHQKVPEAYKFKERLILFNYNVDIYTIDETYIIDVRHVGIFQLM
jgi:hypothetical protein